MKRIWTYSYVLLRDKKISSLAACSNSLDVVFFLLFSGRLISVFVLQSWSNSVAAVGHQGGRGPLSCVWGVAGLTWAGRNRRWQGDCCLPPDSVCICLCRWVCVCDWGCFACSNVLSWATPKAWGPCLPGCQLWLLGFPAARAHFGWFDLTCWT